MCMRILCLVLTLTVAVNAGQFLSHLYGKNGQNYMLICLKAAEGRRERACPGALLGYEWVGVSAGCLQQHPQRRMLALRQTKGERCEDVLNASSTLRAREVWDHFYHPWLDLALVLLDRPYFTLDVHPNSTAWTVSRAFRKHGQWKWMKQYMKTSTIERDRVQMYKSISEGMISMRAPLLITFLAIIMPIVLFVLFSIYFLYYTGSSKVTYERLEYNKTKV